MATSGTREFTLDVAEIMEDAFERVGLEMRTGYDARRGRRSLNILFQDWGNRGVNLWTVQAVSTPLVVGQASYTLDSDDVDIAESTIAVGSIDYPLTRMTRSDYAGIPNKLTQSRPTQVYVERTAPMRITLWPVPSAASTLTTYRIRRIQDVESSGNNVDLPARFIPAAVSGLAYYLSLALAPDRALLMKQVYEEDFQRAANEDSERGSLFIRPKIR